MKHRFFRTSMGISAVLGDEQGIFAVLLPADYDTSRQRVAQTWPHSVEEPTLAEELVARVVDFLSGKDVDIPLDLVNTSVCTPFQLRVLVAERSIPRGMTASYTWLARRAGTKAVRAAGSALARNPFPIVVPCHRAIRSDRTLGNYQGGTPMKRRLLEMEGVRFDPDGRVSVDFFLP
ncbi:MAG: methylated-DNA--[protein]-cysteine S-methyltransferase [Candidatus Thorarchaeota archaeon]|nr:methylated-DNA--[protein]-cysteine S-methyltransferase [Candidatus Thorarchaeota archaeon]